MSLCGKLGIIGLLGYLFWVGNYSWKIMTFIMTEGVWQIKAPSWSQSTWDESPKLKLSTFRVLASTFNIKQYYGMPCTIRGYQILWVICISGQEIWMRNFGIDDRRVDTIKLELEVKVLEAKAQSQNYQHFRFRLQPAK